MVVYDTLVCQGWTERSITLCARTLDATDSHSSEQLAAFFANWKTAPRTNSISRISIQKIRAELDNIQKRSLLHISEFPKNGLCPGWT